MIKINDVKYSYENSETEALRGVSISIADGEFVAIVGHNGSGKSTLAKMLNALQLPSSGSVTVFGMDTADESKTALSLIFYGTADWKKYVKKSEKSIPVEAENDEAELEMQTE